MATYVEKCSGGAPETAIAKFNDDATITLYHRQPDQRPGPRDGDHADRLGAARHRCRAHQDRAGRHRRRARGLHRRQPHRRGRRRGDAGRRRQDHRQGQAGGGERCWRRAPPTSTTRTAAFRIVGTDRTHEPVRRRQGRQGSQARADGREARPRRRVHAHARGRHLPQRLPHLRARDRSRHRHARDRELQRDGRFRHARSIRCCCRARSMAASARAWARR